LFHSFVSSWVGPAVAYLRYRRHGSCHGQHFDGDANLLGKNKVYDLQLLESVMWAPYNH